MLYQKAQLKILVIQEKFLLSISKVEQFSLLLNIFSENNFINGPPMIKTTIKEVTTERPVLNVRYLNTFRNEY